MNNQASSITILTCHEPLKMATKKFIMLEDQSIKKVSSNTGMYFTYEELPVSDLAELSKRLEALAADPKKCLIRGQIKENMPEVVRRKKHNPEAAFDPIARPYVMLDFDKQSCPDYFDPKKNPHEIVVWLQNKLPKAFRDTSCYYKFSSSQSVYTKDKGKNTVSMHLWYWCDRAVLDDEWKRYFYSQSAPVDIALFDAVQMHYTANPIFENMQDPLSERSGTYMGKNEVVIVPQIPEAQVRRSPVRAEKNIDITQASRNEAFERLLPYYQDGVRNTFSGAVAATLYRGGWTAENAATFVHELAEKASDPEADERYNGALRICRAVDLNLPAQGIPTLKKEFSIADIGEILALLGIGSPDLEKELSKLNNRSTPEDIREVIKTLVGLPDSDIDFYTEKIKNITKLNKKVLQLMLKEAATAGPSYGATDLADQVVQGFLQTHFENGKNFIRSSDKRYWFYNKMYWQEMPDDLVKKYILNYARDLLAEGQINVSLSALIDASSNILEGHSYEMEDPFKLFNRNMPPVINCKNGEVWFEENGEAALKPHRADSYLRHCLNVDFDPAASSPEFDQAMKDIFSKSSDPADTTRHFLELAGYICQPWRKIPIIVLLHGEGANGKSSLISILCNVIGYDSVMSGRINEISKDKFKIGALDGKLMLYEDDVGANTRLDDGFLKTIGEEKPLTGEQKYKPPIIFICRAVPVMLSNDYPSISDLSHGLRRRLLVIPFNRQFSANEQDKELFERIWQREASGVLNHFISGFQRLKLRGQFEEPADCLIAKNKWITRSNILPTFISERCSVNGELGQTLKEFYSELRAYCDATGNRGVPRQQWVGSRLESLGYEISIKGGAPYIRGLKANTQSFEEQ